MTAAQLYGPYGGVRYSSGTMPTAKGFTGQRADTSTSGLDYYNARYYDPVLGQFASADTKQGPNRYAYVAGNPETLTDPTGQRCDSDGCGGGGGSGGTGGGTGSGSGGGGGGGLPLSHDIRMEDSGVECKGTPKQCDAWYQQLQDAITAKQSEQDLLWAAMGLIQGVWDLWQLITDKKDAVEAAIDALAIVGDLLTTATYVLDWAQQNGHDVSGLEHIVGLAGMAVNYLAGPLEALKNAAGPIAGALRAAVSVGWNAFRIAAEDSNPVGAAINAGMWAATAFGIGLEGVALNPENAVDGLLHVLQGRVDQDASDIATLEGDTVDQYCSSSKPSPCANYP